MTWSSHKSLISNILTHLHSMISTACTAARNFDMTSSQIEENLKKERKIIVLQAYLDFPLTHLTDQSNLMVF